MKNSISTEDKKKFIKYLLENHNFKREEDKYLVKWLASQEDLSKIRFKRFVEGESNSIMITTKEIGGLGMIFYDGNTNRYINRFDIIDKVTKGDYPILNIEVIFPGRFKNVDYLAVEEQSLYEGDGSLIIEEISVHSVKNFYKMKIDEALDNSDQEMFIRYCRKLAELREELKQDEQKS